MAITFTPKGGTAFTIGGQTTASNGLVGPFANLSISKEIRRQDSLILGEKHSISITGTVLIKGDHLTTGVRQAAVFAEIKKIIDSGISKEGTLDIDAYGGVGTGLQFTNAFLVSADAPDQDEASMGTQNQAYSFTFEAFSDTNADPYDGTGSLTGTKWIESFEESWDMNVQEGPYSNIAIDPVTATQLYPTAIIVYKTYTISHTISAQAVSPYPDSGNMGYKKAKAFVEERLSDTPLATGTTKDARGSVIDLDVPSGYATYNHVRQRTQNITGGNYSVSESWIASKYSATHSVDYSLNKDASAEHNTVDVNVSAQGLDLKHPESSDRQDKYTNALANWATVKTAAENGAAAFYALANPNSSYSLRTVKRSQSESHNKTDGNLTYSCTFDDGVINYPNAISESLSVTYDNVEALNEIVVVIPVLEKINGPVIQDMKTTNEKVVSVSLDITMGRDHRTHKPGDGGTSDPTVIAEAYKPASSIVSGPYQRTKSENWNPYSGSYNLSMEWVYI
jgi:hypothetical protein